MNNNLEEKNEKIEAGKNTAHVAGRVASRYFGGELGGKTYDALSRTKAGQALERGVGKRVSNTPIIGDVNKKINDTGAVDAANKAVDMLGGNPTNSKNGLNSVNTKKLNSKLKSRNKNSDDTTPDALKNKNKGGLRNRSLLGGITSSLSEENDTKDENQENNSDSFDNDTVSNESQIGRSILKKILPILMMIAPFLLIVLLIIGILSPIFSAYSWFYSLFNHKSDDASSYTVYNAEQSEQLKKEQAYNDAILGSKDGSVKGIVAEYQEKYGVTIDWYLLNAVITYRYTAIDSDKLYTNEDDIEIDDSEVEDLLDDETNSDSDESTSSSVDYTEAKKKIKTVAKLMITNNGGSYTADNKVDGDFYNRLIDSSFLKSYYKPLLRDNEYETRKELVDEIFEYAQGARDLLIEDDGKNGGVISELSIVHLQTCEKTASSGWYTYKKINGFRVYDNPPNNTGTSYPDYMDMKNYIKGVVTAEIGISENYKEAMKAQAIAALSYMINKKESGFNMKTGELYFPNGTCRQAACYPEYGCSSKTVKGGIMTFYPGENTARRRRGPLSAQENAILDDVLNDVFGKVMVKKGVTASSYAGSSDTINARYLDSCSGGSCFSQKDAQKEAKNGMTYVEILKKHYSSVDFDIIDITEGLYYKTEDEFNGTLTLNEAFHFHQGDYRGSNSFCEGGTISARGCSVSSTAIVVSLLTGERHDPMEISSRLKSARKCNGNRVTYPASAATFYSLDSYTVSKNNAGSVSKMLSDLANGKTAVVARIAPNSGRYRTKSGHYIALVGVKTEGGRTKVLVWDPGNSSSSRDNYWADFNNDILKYASNPSFVVLSRR